MMAVAISLGVLVAYLLGSVNFAVIISKKVYKKDVRSLGSGNAGMTNMARNFGKKAAIVTLLGDLAKGAVAVLLGRLLVFALSPGADMLLGAYAAGIAVIVGHMFPVFFGFRGGKGVATVAGVILALNPPIAIALTCVFLLFFKTTGMVSLGSVVGISLYPVATVLWAVFVSGRLPVFSLVCSLIITALIVVMHRENIQRIRKGSEYRFKKEDKGTKEKKNETEKV